MTDPVESPSPSVERLDLQSRVRGVYALTPGWSDTAKLLDAVQAVLDAGVQLVQYRAKQLPPDVRAAQIDALAQRCAQAGALLVINDDWARLARGPHGGEHSSGAPVTVPAGIAGVHIGRDDGEAAQVRAALGDTLLIGLSCYDDLDRARNMAADVDYLAFGSLFPSATKPTAAAASLECITKARPFGRPVVGIGGIGPKNAELVRLAGADAIAVIDALFGDAAVQAAGSVGAAARELVRAFEGH